MKIIKLTIQIFIIVSVFTLNCLAFIPKLDGCGYYFYFWTALVTAIITTLATSLSVKFGNWFESKLKD
jgi:hypothetical protein